MSSLQSVLAEARALLLTSQTDKALETLSPYIESNQDNVSFLQVLGEALLENSDLEQAYDVLARACELDPQAGLGSEKFFYLGQMIGGVDGIGALNIGLNRIQQQMNLVETEDMAEVAKDEVLTQLAQQYSDKESLKAYLIKKLNQGMFAKIEIWMTDLCMEPEAEQECNDIIEFCLKVDNGNAEAWSLLASIRISQQRREEAVEAIERAWELFVIKKTQLENAANEKDADSLEVNMEYIELIQPLLTIARFAIELELFELAISISSSIQDINEGIVESYYLEGFANYLQAKKIQFQSNNQGVEDYNEIQLNLNVQDESISFIKDSQLALSGGYKLLQVDDDVDPELAEQINVLVNEVGGPILKREKIDVNDETWEDEIQSDDE